MFRAACIVAALAAVLATPFLLRPSRQDAPARAHAADILTIITPHNETIRSEFGQAFRAHVRSATGRDVHVDWRTLGGTSEIERYLDTSYAFAFRRHWEEDLLLEWDAAQVGSRFDDRRLVLPADPAQDDLGQHARRTFLASNVGIGIDLFFGGGAYPFVIHAEKGHLVDSGVARRHPEWFRDEIIPEIFSGERFYDREHRWVGACLSSFGICSNTDSLRRLGLPLDPPDWDTLADPRLLGQVALADPAKSGSATKAFEMLFQQKMRLRLEASRGESGADEPSPGQELAAVAAGWDDALRLVQRIAGNARYFSNIAPKIPLEVAQGDAAMGMCIDFFGRTYNERLRQPGGASRVQYVTPAGGSSTGVDPIALLRGAPNPELAGMFIDFVLSEDGQRLWNSRVGAPGGPARTALRRLSVRRDLYTPEHLAHASDPEVLPFAEGQAFLYEPAWTERSFGALRFILRCACLDPHDELRAAWEALIRHGFPPEATAAFHDISPARYAEATGPIGAALRTGDARAELRLARELTGHFRDRYRSAAALAGQGR